MEFVKCVLAILTVCPGGGVFPREGSTKSRWPPCPRTSVRLGQGQGPTHGPPSPLSSRSLLRPATKGSIVWGLLLSEGLHEPLWMPKCIHARGCVYAHTYECACVHMCWYTRVCMEYVCLHMHACMHMWINMCTQALKDCRYACAYVRVHVCTHTGRGETCLKHFWVADASEQGEGLWKGLTRWWRFLRPRRKIISSLSGSHSCLYLAFAVVQKPQRVFYLPCFLCRNEEEQAYGSFLHSSFASLVCCNLGFQGKTHKNFSTLFQPLFRPSSLDPVHSVWHFSHVSRITVKYPVPLHPGSGFPRSTEALPLPQLSRALAGPVRAEACQEPWLLCRLVWAIPVHWSFLDSHLLP